VLPEGVTVLSAIGVVGDYLPDGPQKQIVDQMAVTVQTEVRLPAASVRARRLQRLSAPLRGHQEGRQHGFTPRFQQALEHMTLVTPNGKFQYTPIDHSGLSPDFISINVVKGGQLVPTEWARQRL